MAIGSVNLGATPCCGLITRTWECYPDKTSETGRRHTNCQEAENDAYVPGFPKERRSLRWGCCPDCGQSIIAWAERECKDGHAARTKDGWHWDYSRALAEFQRQSLNLRDKVCQFLRNRVSFSDLRKAME